ncbi:hypothetical protein [Aeromonas phage phiWae14]|nr:hypothetical protein [Aeromonas phage phiWae14]
MRTQAGLPVAGFMSQLVNKTAISLIAAPSRTSSMPVYFSYVGGKVIMEVPTYNLKQEIILGMPYVNITWTGPVEAQGYRGGWQRMDAGMIKMVKTIQATTEFVITFSSSPDGTTSRHQWTFKN